MFSEESKALLAILSLGLVVVGFFWGMIFVAPPAIVCAVLALYTAPGEKLIETIYRWCAFIGLAGGIFEVIAAILVLSGLVTLGI